MKFVADALGIEVSTAPWDGAGKMPYYLVDRYEFSKADLGGVKCILMKPHGELDTLTAIKKHIAKVKGIDPMPIVLGLDGITARRRKSLIEAHIPFVAPLCHIYLPFMGIALIERYTASEAPKEILMPSSQLLLFYYLYQSEFELRSGETADVFGVSPMQITRAIRQLTALGLVSVKKEGVRTIIFSDESRRDLFERAKPHLLNPVRKRFFIDHDEMPPGLPLSGFSALSGLTMLGKPQTDTYAFFGGITDFFNRDILVDNTVQVEIEIWRYNPGFLSKMDGVVDSLSLVASLPDDDDPRIEEAVDELLSDLWR